MHVKGIKVKVAVRTLPSRRVEISLVGVDSWLSRNLTNTHDGSRWDEEQAALLSRYRRFRRR